MINFIKNGGCLEKGEEAIRNLGSEISGKLKTNTLSLKACEKKAYSHTQKVLEKFCDPDSFPSDCVLIVEGKRVHVNKRFLSMHSKVFNTLFYGDFAEKDNCEIFIADVDAGEFCHLLEVIYPNNYKGIITVENVEFVLKLADRFGVCVVLRLCEEFIRNSPGCFNNAKKMLIAQEYGLKIVMVLCILQYKSAEHLNELMNELEYSALNDNTKRMVGDNIRRYNK